MDDGESEARSNDPQFERNLQLEHINVAISIQASKFIHYAAISKKEIPKISFKNQQTG